MTGIAETLRREFDAAFAAPPRGSSEDSAAFLLIGVGGNAFALDVRDVGGMAAGRWVTPAPSPDSALIGLSAIRGKVVPVFDLGAVLGEPRSTEGQRWIVLSRDQDPIAFAFSELQGHLRVDRSELATIDNPRDAWIRQVLRTETGMRPIIVVADLSAAVRGRTEAKRKGTVNNG